MVNFLVVFVKEFFLVLILRIRGVGICFGWDVIIPWPLHTQWFTFLARFKMMTVYCFHIYWKGNVVADSFANMGLAFSTLAWHASPLSTILASLHSDFLALPGGSGDTIHTPIFTFHTPFDFLQSFNLTVGN
ncbi:hypothetical protein DVH24_039258 [Malus domestica]|uniref:RNase H type-1 domain-containing protein n=1 Tax=Malus domestica TaxID=3750 RepID=A0A498HY60_MALDO|nr:hypothetical protein DVH24_039258 [Malus domestica]